MAVVAAAVAAAAVQRGGKGKRKSEEEMSGAQCFYFYCSEYVRLALLQTGTVDVADLI